MPATGSTALMVRVNDDGTTVTSSSDPWYQAIRAMIVLALEGQISLDDLHAWAIHWYVQLDQDRRDFWIKDHAARRLLEMLALQAWEPACACDPYNLRDDCPTKHRYAPDRDALHLLDLRDAIGYPG